MIEYEENEIQDIDLNLSDEHLQNKEKRFVSMKRQKNRKRRLLNGLSHSRYYKPSIWRDLKWDEELEEYLYTNRVKRHKNSKTQKWLKKTSARTVRHLPPEVLPPKGNYYRKVFDYWWIWI